MTGSTTRRNFLGMASAGAALLSPRDVAAAELSADPAAAEWLASWMNARALAGGLYLFRFKDPVYVVTKPIGWKPDRPDDADLPTVSVPVGFVTDFASIPRAFWSALRPDGDYAYAAVLHDYLYWTQTTSRLKADRVLRAGMVDLRIPSATSTVIYEAVRWGGGSAWSDNAARRGAGERRFLSRYPDDPLVTWAEWRSRPDVFRL